MATAGIILVVCAVAAVFYLRAVPAPTSRPAPVQYTTEEERLVGQALVGIGTGAAVGGGGGAALAGLDIGAAVGGGGGAASEAGALGALAGGLIAGGPIGAILGGGLAIYSQQVALMGEVREFRDIQYRLTPTEDAKWVGMDNPTHVWPTSADPWRHKALHAFEVTMTDKYTGTTGIEDFRVRLAAWVARTPGMLSARGAAWATANGLTQRAVTQEERAALWAALTARFGPAGGAA